LTADCYRNQKGWLRSVLFWRLWDDWEFLFRRIIGFCT